MTGTAQQHTIKEYAHNLTLSHTGYDDLLTPQEESVYKFLMLMIQSIEKQLSPLEEYNKYTYFILENGDHLFVYANKEMEHPVQLALYNTTNKTLETEFDYSRLSVLEDEYYQAYAHSKVLGFRDIINYNEAFPEASDRLYELLNQTEEIHEQKYIKWDLDMR